MYVYLCVCRERERYRDRESNKRDEIAYHFWDFLFFLCFSFPVRWVNMPPEEQSVGWVFILFWFFFSMSGVNEQQERVTKL